jgi:predicted RNA-binding protein with PIN domain
MRIVIDGYNLLKAMPECRALETLDPEQVREHLIALLGRYRRLKGHHVVVVFDGWLEGHPPPRHLHNRGVQVIYSRRGGPADDVIRRMASHVAHQGVVVASDRALARHTECEGAEVIGSAEFGERWRTALPSSGRGETDRPEMPHPASQSPQKGLRTGRHVPNGGAKASCTISSGLSRG